MTDYDEEHGAQLSPEDEERLWTEMTSCLGDTHSSHESIDDALRSWLDLATQVRDTTPTDSHEEVATCVQLLLQSPTFQSNREYVRTQIIYSLLQEDDAGPLHAIACLLLLDGHMHDTTFPQMIQEACFPRLLDLIKHGPGDPRLHRLLLQLMYEMSRMERLRPEDLVLVDDEFIQHLFGIIEGVSNDVNDPYHYPTIRVLLVLNEQYMLASTESVTEPDSNTPLTNRIVKCVSLHGSSYRTFGENIILLLNRETETSLQLLILKLLYLLFTNKATYEYFYTNDLRVLLDVIIRNLMDLPDEKLSLRHTYLRVLYPLLAHTQLNQPPHYKHDEISRVLKILRGSQNAHFAPADDTTVRLVDRVAKVKWIADVVDSDLDSPDGEGEVARKFLGISLTPAEAASSISVVDIAAVTEKPGVQTPSRNAAGDHAITRAKKPLPAVPKHRHGVPFTRGQSIPIPIPTIHVNGVNGQTMKKIPPKAPPPRRWGKMKTVETSPADSTADSPSSD